MRNHSCRAVIVAFVAFLTGLTACSPVSQPGGGSPAGFERDERAPQLPYLVEVDPVVVEPLDLPLGSVGRALDRRDVGRRLESPLTEDEIRRLQHDALEAPPNPMVQMLKAGPSFAPVLGVAFESLDFVTAGGNFVPPDPELAVGPGHIVAVVNDYIEIYDRFGTPLLPPIQFAAFFSGIPGCTGLFDPNVLYDEHLDRFVVGIDANGTGYCVAMTQTANPVAAWTAYGFGTVPPSPTPDFFDYPHAGVGQDAIYMGANIFNNAATVFLRAEVWAMDKLAMAMGLPLPAPLVQTVVGGFTPQPMNAHGMAQATWPFGEPHFIIANQIVPGYSGDLFDIWAWNDPFGANTYSQVGTVNLAATTFPAGYPIDAPQSGAPNIQANDWRVLDAEYRNGDIWMTQTISCNPGGGVVDCVRWAEIDFSPSPTYTPTVLQAGVFATVDEFRIFPDLAVNHCDDMTIGYTKTSPMMWPAVWVTGRLSTDPPNLLQAEALLRPGDVPYSSWDGPPHRWGDYTGGTSDPDGVGTWYLGEYSKLIFPTPLANWGTFVGEYATGCGVDLGVTKTDGVTQVAPGGSVTYTITVTNFGPGDAIFASIVDTFPADLSGVTWTCSGQTGPPSSFCHVASGAGDINLNADLQSGSSISIVATGTLSAMATGSLVNTASTSTVGIVDPFPGNNSATDTDTLTPEADLVVEVTDGSCYVLPGGSLTYTVTVDNLGPSHAPAASISDSAPVELTITSWTCAASGSAACGSASGSGPLTDSPSISSGDGVTYSVSGTVSGSASGWLVYTVNAAPGVGVVDPNGGNDSDLDRNALETPIFCDGFEMGTTGGWSTATP